VEEKAVVDGLFACEIGREEMEDAIDMDGVGVPADLAEDAVGDMLAKRSLMLDAGRGATGFGVTNGVEEVMVEIAGGGDVRPENAARCASVVRPGVVAD
jgi:hypothetical protein